MRKAHAAYQACHRRAKPCALHCLASAVILLAAFAVQREAAARWLSLWTVPSSPTTGATAGAAHDLVASTSTHRGSEPTARYELKATLDAERRSITAAGTIRWTNTSSRPQSELWFHLYLNAFSSEETRFMRSAPAAHRSAPSLGERGSIEVLYLRARELGGGELWSGAASHSPGDPLDATDIVVPLPHAVPPGSTVHLEMGFKATLPRLVERTGFVDDFFMVAQWYPKLARLEPDGTWAHFAFDSQAEFYADFATYRVILDVPAEYVVAATGRRLQTTQRGKRRIEEFQERRVHDFAWAAWPHFETETFATAGVQVTLYAPPGHGYARAATKHAIRNALPHFEHLYGPYPYANLRVVHPPSKAAPAGGMEYPTLITTGGHWVLPGLGIRSIETVTIHELAHQWFYGLVASDERRWPFLDEGLATYAEMRALEGIYGPGSSISVAALRVSRLAELRSVAASAPIEPSSQPAVAFDGFAELGALAYARPAVALETLARVYGRARVQAALAAYATDNRFRHATPESLLRSVRQEVGSEAALALRRALLEGADLDFEVAGWDASTRDPSGSVESRILIRRNGALELPVEILLKDQDGQCHARTLDGSKETQWVVHRGSSPIASVVLDPEHRLLLDRALLNNAMAAAPPSFIRLQAQLSLLAQLMTLGATL